VHTVNGAAGGHLSAPGTGRGRPTARQLSAAVLAAAASGTGGAATIALLHRAAPYWDVWRAWFLSDWVGIFIVAPLVIGLSEV
jgi:integral membrane sensor domain MASE1